MSNKQNVPAKTAHYPKRTNLLLKRTSLLIDELDVRREEEEKFQLTPYEACLLYTSDKDSEYFS